CGPGCTPRMRRGSPDGVHSSSGGVSVVRGAMGEAGKLAGRYRLLNPLGGGELLLAFDEVEHRDVVVRRLRAPGGRLDEAVLEARRAAGFVHPAIVPVLDVPMADGEPWLGLAFAAGSSLEQAGRGRGALPVRQAGAARGGAGAGGDGRTVGRALALGVDGGAGGGARARRGADGHRAAVDGGAGAADRAQQALVGDAATLRPEDAGRHAAVRGGVQG